MNRFLCALLLAATLGAALLAPPARAAVPGPDVLAAAKKEGTVTWYTSIEAPTIRGIVQRFEQAYPGITVQPLRLGSSQLPPRIITEERGGKYNADVADADDFQFHQLVEAGAITRAPNPEPKAFIKGMVDPGGLWSALFFSTTVIAWNTQKVKADGLRPPTSLADLAKPEWKGKIGIDSEAFNWYTGVLATQPGAADLLKKIAANSPLITNGHTEGTAQLESGEFDVTPTAYGYTVDHERLAGRPVEFVNPKPLIVTLHPVGIVKNPPHPNAARLFEDWLLSKDGQEALLEIGDRSSSRLDVAGNPRVYDPKAASYIVPAPDSSRYATLVSQYRALLGIAQ